MKNAEKDYTSYTGLSGIDGWLRHVPPFFGNEGFLILGRAVHEKWLEGKESYTKQLTEKQKHQLVCMVNSLNKSKEAMALHKGARKEHKFEPLLEIPNFDIKIKLIMDILCKKSVYGADLKTTGAKNKEQFLKGARSFGYFGQEYIYKNVSGVANFYIIAVQKEEPYEVFIFNASDYPEDQRKAKEKVDFLAYVFKNHRKDIDI